VLKRILTAGVSLLATLSLTGAPARASAYPWDAHGTPTAPGAPHILTGTSRVYGVGQQAITNTGGCANITVPSSVFVDSNDGHSLAQFAISRGGTSNDVAEFGWRAVPGTTAPKLFGSLFKAGVWQGYNTASWQDNTSNPINLNSTVNPGTTKAMCLVYDAGTSAWVAWYDGSWVAQLPGATWSTGGAFTSGDQFQEFTEIAYDTTRAFSCSDMGDGRKPVSTTMVDALQFASTTLQGISSALINLTVTTQGTIHSPAEYGVVKLSARTFTAGGPGRNSTNTATGSIGSC
jgi:hypothetical protein